MQTAENIDNYPQSGPQIENTTISNFDLNVNSTKTVLQATTSKQQRLTVAPALPKPGLASSRNEDLPKQSTGHTHEMNGNELLVLSFFLTISHCMWLMMAPKIDFEKIKFYSLSILKASPRLVTAPTVFACWMRAQNPHQYKTQQSLQALPLIIGFKFTQGSANREQSGRRRNGTYLDSISFSNHFAILTQTIEIQTWYTHR